MIKRSSIGDLARELNLSVSTVSRALNDSPSISPATKRRVWELARARHYQLNHQASGLSRGKSRLVGVLVPKIDAHFFGTVVRGVERVARQAGYHILIAQSDEDTNNEAAASIAMAQAGVAGMLASLAHSTHNLNHFEQLKWQGIPVVLFDRTLAGADISAVVVDDYYGAREVVNHLLAQGARRVALLSGPEHHNIYRNRYRGYRDALSAMGLPVVEDLIFRMDMSLEGGRAGMQHLLRDNSVPDAVFSAGDTAALGALQVLKEYGLNVPGDVLLAGFGNESFAQHLEPTLTTVDQGCEQMGESAMKLLMDLLGTDAAPRRLVLRPELIVRQSSRLRQT